MSSVHAQATILAPAPNHGRSLVFRLVPDRDVKPTLARLVAGWQEEWGVIGFGQPLVAALGLNVAGLRTFPALSAAGIAVPSTQQALWVMLHGRDATEVFDRQQQLMALIGHGLILDDGVDVFLYAGGRDLTGYEDGTANPPLEDAPAVALVGANQGAPEHSSFVAVQRWQHDLAHFRSHGAAERDDMIGRRHSDNEEMEDAPESAHVKRTEQEGFDPEAFLWRRSMPWSTATAQGLEFIAFGHSLAPFERILRHMTGADDGITDALFRFSRPITGGYYWCPALKDGRLDIPQ